MYDQPSSSHIHFLPKTINRLAKRFSELFPKYWARKEPDSHNELVSLLDELLHRHGITHEIYEKMNFIQWVKYSYISQKKVTEKISGGY